MGRNISVARCGRRPRSATSPSTISSLASPTKTHTSSDYNRTVRHEWLGCFTFDTIKEVQNHATRWLWTYNNDRPNMAIGGITPRQKLKMAV